MKSNYRVILALCLLGASALLTLPALAERDLSIDDVALNSQSSRDIQVEAGQRIYGTVRVSTASSSLFRTHTGVWLPSWEKYDGAMRVFLDSIGGTANALVSIDVQAPNVPGTYYLLFCFDRKHANEMLNEMNLRSNEQVYSNGRAIRINVGGFAWPGSSSSSPIANGLFSNLIAPNAAAMTLELDGQQRSGVAGNGPNSESMWRLSTSSLSTFGRDDAVRVRVLGDRPTVDLDLEIVDQYGRRRGYSEREGSFGEQSIVRVKPDDILYARVFGFKPGVEAPFRIFADRVSAFTSRIDPSFGRATAAGDGSSFTDRAGHEATNPRWYSFTLPQDGSFEIEVRGNEPQKDLDLWVFDDLGNLRGSSRLQGSTLEQARVEYAEAGVYYVKVGAATGFDESDYRIGFRISSTMFSPSSSDKYKQTVQFPSSTSQSPSHGVEINLGGIRFRIP